MMLQVSVKKGKETFNVELEFGDFPYCCSMEVLSNIDVSDSFDYEGTKVEFSPSKRAYIYRKLWREVLKACRKEWDKQNCTYIMISDVRRKDLHVDEKPWHNLSLYEMAKVLKFKEGGRCWNINHNRYNYMFYRVLSRRKKED